MNINWKKWKTLIIIGVAIPFGTIAMSQVDKIMYDVDVFNDIYYMYLSQISLTLFTCLYFLVDIWSKQKKEEK